MDLQQGYDADEEMLSAKGAGRYMSSIRIWHKAHRLPDPTDYRHELVLDGWAKNYPKAVKQSTPLVRADLSRIVEWTMKAPDAGRNLALLRLVQSGVGPSVIGKVTSWSQIGLHEANPCLRVKGKDIPLTSEALAALVLHRETSNGDVPFPMPSGEPMNQNNVTKIVGQYRRAAGVPTRGQLSDLDLGLVLNAATEISPMAAANRSGSTMNCWGAFRGSEMRHLRVRDVSDEEKTDPKGIRRNVLVIDILKSKTGPARTTHIFANDDPLVDAYAAWIQWRDVLTGLAGGSLNPNAPAFPPLLKDGRLADGWETQFLSATAWRKRQAAIFEAVFPKTKGLNPHSYRRGYVTDSHFVDGLALADISNHVGHSSVSVTEGYIERALVVNEATLVDPPSALRTDLDKLSSAVEDEW